MFEKGERNRKLISLINAFWEWKALKVPGYKVQAQIKRSGRP